MGEFLIAGPGRFVSGHVPVSGETPIQRPYVFDVPVVNRTAQLAGKLPVALIQKCDAHATYEARKAALERACSDPMKPGFGGPRQRNDAPRARAAFAARYPSPPAPDAREWGQYVDAIKAVEQEYRTAAADTPVPPLDRQSWQVSWGFRGGQTAVTNVAMSPAAIRELYANPDVNRGGIQLWDAGFQHGQGRWIPASKFAELVAAQGPV